MPPTAIAVHTAQSTLSRCRSHNHSSSAANTGPVPSDTTLPIATPARFIDV